MMRGGRNTLPSENNVVSPAIMGNGKKLMTSINQSCDSINSGNMGAGKEIRNNVQGL